MTKACQENCTRRERLLSNLVVVILLIFLAFEAAAAGTNDSGTRSYLPYLNGRPWPQIPSIKYIETTSNIWVHPTGPKRFPTVQEFAEPDADFATVVIRRSDGTVYKTYNARLLGPYLSAVYMGDFNNDGIPDFLWTSSRALEMGWPGNTASGFSLSQKVKITASQGFGPWTLDRRI